MTQVVDAKVGKLCRLPRLIPGPLDVGQRLQADRVRQQPRTALPLGQVGDDVDHRAAIHLLVPRKIAGQIDRASEAKIEIIPEGDLHRVIVPVCIRARGSCRLMPAARNPQRRDPALIKALRKARSMVGKDARAMPWIDAAPASPYLRKMVRLAFLAPDIQRDILAGRQPPRLTLEQLIRMEIPAGWDEQRRLLGWPAAA